MESRSTLPLALFLAIATASNGGAEESRAVDPSNSIVATAVPGIRADRLSPRQRRAWAAIEQIVFAKDAAGRFVHPRLHGLWHWVAASGHVVHVELPKPKARGDHQAGRFEIEKVDPDGKRHIAVIRLCLPVIDGALVRKGASGAGDFVRFAGLKKAERYAEILGHELAHAVWTLKEREHARLVEELDREIREFESRRTQNTRGKVPDETALQHLRRIESLVAAIELPAETAEEEIWRELLRGHR